jgi:hypothetical protein
LAAALRMRLSWTFRDLRLHIGQPRTIAKMLRSHAWIVYVAAAGALQMRLSWIFKTCSYTQGSTTPFADKVSLCAHTNDTR